MTLYAAWDEIIIYYNVTYKDGFNGLVFTDQTSSVQKGHATPAFNGETPSRPGYVFNGWTPALEDTVTRDTVYIASWTQLKYTVNFETNGGSTIAPIIDLVYGDSISEPSNPTRDGYRFIGWYLDETLTTPVDFINLEVQEDMTLYAAWDEIIIYYNVTYKDGFDGLVFADQTNTVQKGFATPVFVGETPSRPGYVFNGWTPDIADVVLGDVVYTASWTQLKYTVTFDSKGGSSIAPITDLIYGDSIDEPNNPTKIGYTFEGWYLDENLTMSVDFDTLEIKGNMTLYAAWDEIIIYHNVTYKDGFNGIVFPDQVSSVKKGDSTPSFVGETPSREGYIFNGWTPSIADVVTRDMVYTANWTRITYTVSFDSNGGTPVDSILDVGLGDSILEPDEPLRTGYLFKGWYRDEQLTELVDFTTLQVLNDMTLYAKWEEIIVYYTVTYKDGFNGVVFDDQVTKVQKGFATPKFKGETPSREGYLFNGWTPSVEDDVYDNAIYTATWTKLKYTVTFESNGGSLVDPIEGLFFGDSVVKPTNPTRTGYTFIGWYYDSTLLDIVDFASIKIKDNLTLYAKWEEIPVYYTISYEDGFEGEAFDDQVYSVIKGGQRPGFKGDIPTHKGYIFVGWDSEFIDSVHEDRVYTAQWKKIMYTVDFISNGGSSVAPIVDLEYGQSITKPNNPTLEGYVFKGWYFDDGMFLKEIDFDKFIITDNVKLYAQWTKEDTPIPPVTPTEPDQGEDGNNSGNKLPETGFEMSHSILLGLSVSGLGLLILAKNKKEDEA